ncbi:phosphocholine cytidylyltransferase family protein [Alteromonas sp. MYP5]|uniref:Phosphocholine cytidylyltransferase family protein n=2 Tax=Alteromonas ponticola TaxID=2720613 RepID=A0ABX1QZJ6_9ALTE|nr:phosphocholine cytidylyltransferase family protein [Alteromonas ponticola]
MKAVILVAGRGSRLGEFTANKPKPMTILAGTPLIEWQLQALKQAGIEDIHLVAGYQAEAFNKYQLPTFVNDNWFSSNMVSSLLCADPLLSEHDTIVSYGDIAYHSSIIAKLKASPSGLSITNDKSWLDLWNLRFENPLDDAEEFKCINGHLQAIGKKATNLSEIEGQYMGLLKISAESWREIKTHLLSLPSKELQSKDMTSLLNDLITSGHNIATVDVNGGWVEVDLPSDIICYETQLKLQSDWAHDWRE